MAKIKRGDIWWVDFNPSIGGEIRNLRPAVIVSTDAANRHFNRLVVVPISSSVSKLYPSEARIKIGNRTCKAMVDQVTTASKKRLRDRLGRIADVERVALERALRTHLQLA